MLLPRLARQRIQIQPLKNYFPLHGFLPGLEQPVADFELLDEMEDRRLGFIQLSHAAIALPDQPGLEMQEPHLHSSHRIPGPPEQALRLHGPGVAGFLRFTIIARIQAAERPPLPVLDRRPIGVEDVPLVEDRIDNLVHQRLVHETESLRNLAPAPANVVHRPERRRASAPVLVPRWARRDGS